jgi:glycosyltransferase involved in cell wall biosynthesis
MFTILSVAYPLATTGPDAVGGAEQVLSMLDAALVQAGHQSIVVACEGSSAAGELIPTRRVPDEIDDAVRRESRQRCREAIDWALARYPVDVVHMHGIDFHQYLPDARHPVLATIHLPPGWYPDSVFHSASKRANTFLNFVSGSQKAQCAFAGDAPVIENGVNVDITPEQGRKGDFAVALGRICPEKNFHAAMAAAQRAGVRLILGGCVFGYAEHRRYFEECIRPLLDCRCTFIGPVKSRCKYRLLARARCLLIPSRAPESSSLVAMEALSCGTPVIAFPSGALADIVEPGRTGFLVHDEIEMAEAIAECGAIEPEVCRQTARVRFSAERMCAEYMRLYQQIADLSSSE